MRCFFFLSGLAMFILITSPDAGAQGRSNSTLPVMFDNVRISLKNGGVLVEWSNLTERELVDYVIERSADAKSFTEVSRFKPKSNENVPVSYSDVDPAPLEGLNYYRIRVNEISGKIIFSIILKIETSRAVTGLDIYPNPVTGGQLTWSASSLEAGNCQLSIVSMAGIPVFHKKVRLTGNSITETLDLPSTLPAGHYRLLLRGDGKLQGRSFVIQ